MLLWCDGFDHYGLDESNMTDGVYASAAGGGLSTAQAATGTTSYALTSFDANNQITGPRKVLATPNRKMGVMQRVYFPNLPNITNGAIIADFMTNSALRSHVTCTLDANGAINFYRGQYYGTNGGNGTLIATTDPIITASAWHHIEIQVYIHDTDGWVRVAVNSAHRYEATGLDTSYDASNIFSIAHHNGYYTTTAGVNQTDWYLDDIIYYDFDGDSATDTDFCPPTDINGKATGYIRELQCIYLPMNGDTAQDDWSKSTGSSAFALVDETTPDDSDYIFADNVADVTEMAITDLPPEITYIRGVQLIGRLFKSDAGYAETQFGMKSVAATDDADSRVITVEPTYWWDFMNIDPNSGVRWTRTSLNAAWFRMIRSA